MSLMSSEYRYNVINWQLPFYFHYIGIKIEKVHASKCFTGIVCCILGAECTMDRMLNLRRVPNTHINTL